jgi:hypothetical protein
VKGKVVEEENGIMGLFGAISGFVKGLFGGGSSSGGGGGYSSNTVYEPDKVKVAEIESRTKIRLANMEQERIELMKQAQLDILQYETQCHIALEEAKARGMSVIAQNIVLMQEKLNEVAERRLQIIEKGSLQIVKEIEAFYDEVGDKIQVENDEYNTKKLPALLEILGKYEQGSPEHQIYMQRIQDDCQRQQQYYLKQIDNVYSRQAQVIAGFISSKEKIVEQTGQVTHEMLEAVQNNILHLNASANVSANMQLESQNSTKALPDSKQELLMLDKSSGKNE